MVWGTFSDIRKGSGTLSKVQDGSEVPPGGPRQVRRSSERSGTGREVLPRVRDLSGDSASGSKTSGENLRKIRDGLGWSPERSGMGQGTV